jgi:hypothetical protein
MDLRRSRAIDSGSGFGKKPIGQTFHERRSSSGLDIFNVVLCGRLITLGEYRDFERIRRKKS